MFLSADFINLILYCVQQVGVTLSVGAETILLVAYVQAMRDGVVDIKEAQFARAVRSVLRWGLIAIVASGIAITVLHVMAGEGAVIFSPAYLFKWCLIILAMSVTLLSSYVSPSILEGVGGGTWYALFLVHILAPLTTWTNLLTLYVVWMIGFVLVWWALMLLLNGRKTETPNNIATIAATLPPMAAQPKPASPKPASSPVVVPPKPTPPPPPVQVKPLPVYIPVVTPAPAPRIAPVVQAPPITPPPPPAPKPVPMPPPNLPAIVPQKPVITPTVTIPKPPQPPPAQSQTPKVGMTADASGEIDPDKDPGLPAIRVMPKTKEELETQNRATIVRFE
jgi:hypothetical protein